MPDRSPGPWIPASEIDTVEEIRVRHPLNDDSEVYTRRLSEAAGMERAQVALARLPPGRESFIYHFHRHDEEWIYVLEGRGLARLGDETVEVGPGDFLGFSAPSVAHHLSNPFEEELVYLMGGERHPFDIADFPEAGKMNIKDGDRLYIVDYADAPEKRPTDWQPDVEPMD